MIVGEAFHSRGIASEKYVVEVVLRILFAKVVDYKLEVYESKTKLSTAETLSIDIIAFPVFVLVYVVRDKVFNEPGSKQSVVVIVCWELSDRYSWNSWLGVVIFYRTPH